MRINPEIVHRREADVFRGSGRQHWHDRYLRGRADSPGSLAQGMLQRDGPGTEESSRFPPSLGEVRDSKGRPEGHGWIGSSRRNP